MYNNFNFICKILIFKTITQDINKNLADLRNVLNDQDFLNNLLKKVKTNRIFFIETFYLILII